MTFQGFAVGDSTRTPLLLKYDKPMALCCGFVSRRCELEPFHTRSMRVRQHTVTTWSVLLGTGLLVAGHAHAAQLGKLNVLSNSAEPFQAQIQIEAIRPEERKGLTAKLASPEAFKAARLELNPLLSNLKFEVQDAGQADKALLKISSDKPLPAGFLDALIELSWAGGRVAREYTIQVAEGKIKVPEIRPDQSLPTLSANKAAAPSAAPNEKSADKAAPAKPQTSTELAGTRRVQRGETLSGIASELAGKGVTLNQAMAALYEANPDAFIKGSVHLLREGVQLRIPSRSVMRSKSAQEALIVLADHDDRNVYAAAARRASLSTVGKQTAGQTAQGQVEAPPAKGSEATSAQDRLKIAPGGVSARNDAMAEELTAKNKALNEANERIALLEKNVSDLQKLLEMQKDVAPAATESAATEKPSAESTAATSAEGAPKVEVPVVTAEPPKAEPPAVEEPKKPEPVDQSALTWLLGGAGALVVAVLAGLIWRSRRKATPEALAVTDFESVQPDDEVDVAALKARAQEASTVEAVSNDELDLDELLNQQDPQPSAPPVPEFRIPDEPAQPFEPEPEPETPPMTAEPAPAAPEPQVEVRTTPVDLEFPEDSLETSPAQGTSILDDLDSLESGARSAQVELEALRQTQPPTTEPEPELEPEAPVSTQQSAADAFDQAMADLDLDLPGTETDPAVWQEVATKLDLAGAYVEIGDADGARELLQEIVQKGDAEQVKKAQALLATLG